MLKEGVSVSAENVDIFLIRWWVRRGVVVSLGVIFWRWLMIDLIGDPEIGADVCNRNPLLSPRSVLTFGQFHTKK